MTSIRDIMLIGITLFAIGISLFYTVDIGQKVNNKLLNMSIFNTSTTASSAIIHSQQAINSTDYMYFAGFIGFFIAVIVFGYLVGGNPLFAPIYFFVLVIIVFICVILQLAWGDISSTPEILSLLGTLPLTNFVLSNLGTLMAVMGLTGMFVMFSKPEEQNF